MKPKIVWTKPVGNPVKVSRIGRAMQGCQYSGLLTAREVEIIATFMGAVISCMENPTDPRCHLVADYMDQQGIALEEIRQMSHPSV